MTDRAVSRHPLAASVEAAVAAGVDWVQIRDRELGGAELLSHVEELAAAARRGADARGGALRVLLNRRCDVALAAGLDAVHLGGDALPANRARELLGVAAWIGVSAHTPAEVAVAARAGASYAHLAPILAPLSKRAGRAPLGTDALREAAMSGLPVLAQGGIDTHAIDACLAEGAAGIAVTGAILQAPDPRAAAAALRRALDAAAQVGPPARRGERA